MAFAEQSEACSPENGLAVPSGIIKDKSILFPMEPL